MIFGLYGATRAEELTKVEIGHVKEEGTVFVVDIPETKTDITRKFTVEQEYGEYLKKYRRLRPEKTTTTRFFINYQKGKCVNQSIGKNKFLDTPKVVATFLNLSDPGDYTGHSFRRTSATLLADAGADIVMLKRHGGWKSTTVVKGYVQDSINNKRKIGGLISEQIDLPKTKKFTS